MIVSSITDEAWVCIQEPSKTRQFSSSPLSYVNAYSTVGTVQYIKKRKAHRPWGKKWNARIRFDLSHVLMNWEGILPEQKQWSWNNKIPSRLQKDICYLHVNTTASRPSTQFKTNDLFRLFKEPRGGKGQGPSHSRGEVVWITLTLQTYDNNAWE